MEMNNLANSSEIQDKWIIAELINIAKKFKDERRTRIKQFE